MRLWQPFFEQTVDFRRSECFPDSWKNGNAWSVRMVASILLGDQMKKSLNDDLVTMIRIRLLSNRKSHCGWQQQQQLKNFSAKITLSRNVVKWWCLQAASTSYFQATPSTSATYMCTLLGYFARLVSLKWTKKFNCANICVGKLTIFVKLHNWIVWVLINL